jgi:hypothetical protein
MSETSDPADTGGVLKANNLGAQITPGLDVMSIDGQKLGQVKELGDGEFLVDRPMARDVWIPFSAVVSTAEHGGAFRRGPTQDRQVVLFVSYDDVYNQGWRHP